MQKVLKRVITLCLLLLLFSMPSFAQSKENGAIEGKVLMPDGVPLAGAEMSLSSPNMLGGKNTVFSNDDGKFRFVALPPGVYAMEARMEGFQVTRREGIKLTVNQTLAIDFTLEIGKIEEKITVKGVLPMVDVKDSQTAVTSMTQDMLLNIPNTQFAASIINLAPGVTQDSAFGGSDNGIQYQVDGVDVTDPELHTSYVFLDYGNIQEFSVAGIGAPAEFDGFTGAVFNTVTKSGSNKIQGMFDSFIQDTKWASKNTDDPHLSPPADGLYNVHFDIGGPFVKDKLWFFASAQYCQENTKVTGFPKIQHFWEPRVFFKLNWQPDRDDRLTIFAQFDRYDGEYRDAHANTDPDATISEDSPTFTPNISYLHIFNDHTFLEAKFSGFISYYLLPPTNGYDLPGHYDMKTNRYSVNGNWLYNAYRNRYALNASVSHHADDFIKGSHDFKFGIDTELNPTRTDGGYAGGKYYTEYNGEPYLMYSYEGYSYKALNFRASAFVQDNWSVSDKLKINPGLRVNYYRGSIQSLGTYFNPITTGSMETVFKPDIAFAPRIGITYDLFADHSTALKIHYGKYVNNIITAQYYNFAPTSDWVSYYWDAAVGEYIEDYRSVWDKDKYTFADKYSMPYMNQYTVGIERELFKDVSASLTYVHRDYRNFLDKVNLTGQFVAETFVTPDTGETITVYNQVNPGEDRYLIGNLKAGENYGSAYDFVTFTPSRKYQGLEFVFNKRFSNKWQLMASYTYSKSWGYYDNAVWYDRGQTHYNADLGYSGIFSDPNNQIGLSKDMPSRIDPTHMLKIQGTFILPWDIAFSPYFTLISGNTYTETYSIYLNQGVRYIPKQMLNNLRYPTQVKLDLQAEKTFTIKNNTKIGLMVCVFNLFNAGTVTELGKIVDTGTYQEIMSVVNPRMFRVGLRFYY